MTTPALSIVVPTRNRAWSIRRLVAALDATAANAPPFELIVVDDGSAPSDAAQLASIGAGFEVVIVQQPRHGGPARARNAGARRARANVLLFLDDDVEPVPGLVASHVSLHADGAGLIGLGDLPPVVNDGSYFGIILRGWWQAMRDGIDRPGYRYGFRDLLTGHFSIRSDAFRTLGGFDERLHCHEDWEFGYRALNAGLAMRFLPKAIARHHDTTDVFKALRRKFDEGVADVQLAQLHPALRPALPLSTPPASLGQRAIRLAAWRSHRRPAMLTNPLLRWLRAYESAGLRFRWRILLNRLLTYWYWCGVASVLPRREAAAWQQPWTDAEPSVTVDLDDGVDAAEHWLDALRPQSMRLRYGGQVIGVVPAAIGREPLRGEHLRPILARWFPAAYQRALARHGLMPAVLTPAVPELEHVREVSAS